MPALGILAKTDRIDAWAIARYAEAVIPRSFLAYRDEGELR